MRNRPWASKKTDPQSTIDSLESTALTATEALAESRMLLLENRAMLLAIIKHLGVPYEKSPTGCQKD